MGATTTTTTPPSEIGRYISNSSGLACRKYGWSSGTRSKPSGRTAVWAGSHRARYLCRFRLLKFYIGDDAKAIKRLEVFVLQRTRIRYSNEALQVRIDRACGETVSSSHSSQGATDDRVIVNIDTARFAELVNRKQFYVSISRARHEVSVYTDDSSAGGLNLRRMVRSRHYIGSRRNGPHRPIEIKWHLRRAARGMARLATPIQRRAFVACKGEVTGRVLPGLEPNYGLLF